jgi:type I restriction-modification system DNA methylase subunit
MSKYVCELCKKDFKQKSDYDKHKNNKKPCISISEIEKLTQTKEVKNDNKTNLTTIFKYCLDVLRDNEHLTGDKALRTLAHLLDLRLLEPQFGKTIDIDEFNYDFSHIEDDMIDNHKKKLLSIVRFSKLAQEKEDNIPTNMKYLWDDILAVHPKTKNIFLKGRGFDITNQSTYKKLITKLSSFDFESIEADILGEAYEEVIQDVMIGKTLGQFFTPPKVKKMMVKLIDPQINKNGSIEKIFDPAMGTGGFLITCLRHLINQSKTKNIKLDWDFIRKQGLGGREAEPDTYQLAVSNMLISSGHMFDVLEKGDSIRNPITNKYDIVLANPPFGIDGLTYDDINHALRNEYLPIKSNSAVPLFLQAIIYQLKINGRCAVVLPEGQELFSKSNALVAVREFLMKTCDLKEVIYLPAGTFTHTTIKTCVFYFIKKREGKDALDTNIKVSKITQKETGREYKFSKTHQTTKVHFYDYNPDNDVKHELIEGGVSIDELSKNNYSLNYAEYLKDNVEDEVYEEGIVIKKLGEVCDIDKNITKHSTEYGKSSGKYKFHTGGVRTDLYVDEYDIEDMYIIQNRTNGSGKCNLFLDKKFSLAKQTMVYRAKNKNEITTKYIYYYLSANIDILEKGFIGANHKNISHEYLENIKIPIPSLEKQKEIVSYLDFIYEKCNKTSNDKIEELKKLNEFCLNNQRVFGENEMKTLEDICEFKNGKGIKKENLKDGEYPVIGGGQKPMGLHNEYNTNENVILCSSSGAYAGYISKYEKKVWASDCFSIKPKNKLINNTYLYFTLKLSLQDKIYKSQTGTAQPHIYSKNLEKLKIPVPSLEKQKEIVEYCESNNNLIKQLENEIEQNKIQANLFLSNIVKKVKIEQDELSDDESNSVKSYDSETNQNIIIEDEEDKVIEEVKPKKKVSKKKTLVV